ncbi:hypothetical protein OE88DRAFT_1359566 [Heliocybe sulcata]|uniref:Uncharacterized protein n=1 Tax=Heliocybe sulcata TaxID=5364 RepID=A0A5C3MKI2_9AGAM|nr:hypothetical protein OE88DRAFT_1359566 [Heliocybe sulcata]
MLSCTCSSLLPALDSHVVHRTSTVILLLVTHRQSFRTCLVPRSLYGPTAGHPVTPWGMASPSAGRHFNLVSDGSGLRAHQSSGGLRTAMAGQKEESQLGD